MLILPNVVNPAMMFAVLIFNNQEACLRTFCLILIINLQSNRCLPVYAIYHLRLVANDISRLICRGDFINFGSITVNSSCCIIGWAVMPSISNQSANPSFGDDKACAA
jgi:hypothetical protein